MSICMSRGILFGGEAWYLFSELCPRMERFFEQHEKPSAEQIYKNRDKIETKYFNNTTGDL